MRKVFLYFLILTIVASAAGYVLQVKIAHAIDDIDTGEQVALPGRSLIGVSISFPKANSEISSPVKIQGKAPGTWFFEALLPVKITDKNGTVLGQGPASALSDWMTTELVPFEAVIPFSAPGTPTGFIILTPDNPSGMPDSRMYKIPVKFSKVTAGTPECTTGVAGACSPEGAATKGS